MISLISKESMKTDSTLKINNLELAFRKSYNLLFLVSFTILKNSGSLTDAVQYLFLSLWQKINTNSIKVSFCAYTVKNT